ncbi:SigB/SigF/SigG family RNA polymerase sigma factor [Streptomyces somaliensis DSM 40738]|uniref:SigB/SigF/SigG family RNA polymerase sigma factor n=1 Tax=Streptomyces somaliensis (strain ATCC 33201 / DSM 40738 / JCM 12659 / KCTC 9044 / NCTC 11332 / NRRL B-12077 / IP 733) TaxID=1134445 RepID=A0AA44DFT4_STRE0|nr:SigB/SigF/SigG family RNA polymerase sigma factor [Streptomyces somaliensis]MCQ0021932.1 SigB/SigF/SigG family RNA polymerase sigma factor [Streptomyces somaliensis DSM 40738]NKY15719.1 SigB/SigF/SigG family RNA polymerase sigma factor [Streptomyces somaliensis DSM 40738]
MPTATTTPTATTAPAAPLPRIADPTEVAPQDARELSKQFFARLAVLQEGTEEYQYVRNTLIELNLSLVRYAAARFRSRADQMEDIVQVGTIGLIKAIDRFELSRRVEFATFAMPCVIGEIKRFFRDTSWSVHVPRRLQELRIDIARATDELFQELDRSPTAAELAARLGIEEDEVVEGLVAANGYTAASLDMPLDESGEPASATLADLVGEEDRDMRLTEDVQALKPLVEQLDERDRAILRMRFVEELTQAEIGRRLGVSQMHVSRLLARITARMREELLGGD